MTIAAIGCLAIAVAMCAWVMLYLSTIAHAQNILDGWSHDGWQVILRHRDGEGWACIIGATVYAQYKQSPTDAILAAYGKWRAEEDAVDEMFED